MTAPGTLLMAKMLVPETEQPLTAGRVRNARDGEGSPIFLGAISRGTVDGLQLAINVGAMLITFIALLALLNAMMGGMHTGWPHHVRGSQKACRQLFGWIFAPVAWLIGIPWHDAPKIGNLLGTRMAINEVVAFATARADEGFARSTFLHHRHFRACAASPTSAPSAFRSAASARWLRNSAGSWPSLVFAPCSREPWPT